MAGEAGYKMLTMTPVSPLGPSLSSTCQHWLTAIIMFLTKTNGSCTKYCLFFFFVEEVIEIDR